MIMLSEESKLLIRIRSIMLSEKSKLCYPIFQKYHNSR